MKTIKKYPFGGITQFSDLLGNLKGSDQSEWMGILGGAFPDFSNALQSGSVDNVNQAGQNMFQNAFNTGRNNFAQDYRQQNFDDYYKKSSSWWTRTFNKKKANNQANEALNESVQNQVGSNTNLLGQANAQMGGIEQLFSLFNMLSPQGEQGTSFNPLNWMTNPTRGFQHGGEVAEEGGVSHIQTEKGEMVALENGVITKAKAKKLHKHMDDDEVTDILPEGTLIASRDKKMRFTKKEAEDFVFGYNPIEYTEEGSNSVPKEITMDSFMGKNKLTPADYLKRIKSTYKVEDGEPNDAFLELAKEENLESRIPHIQAMKIMTEMKKPKDRKADQAKFGTTIPTTMPNALNMTRFPVAMYGKGGMTVPKADIGAILGGIGNVFQGFAGMGSAMMQGLTAKRQMKETRELMDRLRGQIDAGASTQQNFLGLGSAASLAGILGQDPTVTAPQLDTRYVDAMPQEMPRYITDQYRRDARMASRPMTNYAMRNAPSFSRGLNAAAMGQANQLNAMGNLAANIGQQNLGMRQNFLNQRGALANQQIMYDTDALNKTRAGRNMQMQGIGGVGANYFSGLGSIDANRLSQQLGVQMGGHNALMGLGQNATNAASMGLFSFANALNPSSMAGADWGNVAPWGGQQQSTGMMNRTPYYNPFGGR